MAQLCPHPPSRHEPIAPPSLHPRARVRQRLQTWNRPVGRSDRSAQPNCLLPQLQTPPFAVRTYNHIVCQRVVRSGCSAPIGHANPLTFRESGGVKRLHLTTGRRTHEKLPQWLSLARRHCSMRRQCLAVKACERRTSTSPPRSFSSLAWHNQLPGCHNYPRYSRATLRSDRRGG